MEHKIAVDFTDSLTLKCLVVLKNLIYYYLPFSLQSKFGKLLLFHMQADQPMWMHKCHFSFVLLCLVMMQCVVKFLILKLLLINDIYTFFLPHDFYLQYLQLMLIMGHGGYVVFFTIKKHSKWNTVAHLKFHVSFWHNSLLL